MRAIRILEYGGAEVLRLEELPDPVPGAGEVLVRLEAIGVNFIEIYRRKGLYRVSLPFTPGTEGAGTVVAVGPGVASSLVGTRVVSQDFRGTYAELSVAPADRVVTVPEGVETQTAAAVMLQGMTAHYLATSTCPLAPGDWCLVHAAAGGVGLLLCQVARMRGARVIGTVSNEQKAQLAREAGAHETINYTSVDFAAAVRTLTGGKGVRVVYDSVGATTFERSLDALAPRGMLVLFGQSSGPVPPFDPQILNAKGSLFLTRPTLGHYIATREELVQRATDVLTWIAEGNLKVRIHATYPLSQAADAQSALESRGTSGKVLLLP